MGIFGHLGLIAEVPEAHGGVWPPQRAEHLIPRRPLTWHGGSGCLGEGGMTEERDKPFIEAGLRHGSEVLAQEVGPWKPWEFDARVGPHSDSPAPALHSLWPSTQKPSPNTTRRCPLDWPFSGHAPPWLLLLSFL